MCGRFSFTDNPDARWLRERFGASLTTGELPGPRWNIAPTDPLITVGADDDGSRAVQVLGWGLWGRRPPLINVRSETALQRRSFRALLERVHTRVLIPADGFYEWLRSERPGGARLPVRFSVDAGRVFAFAGVRCGEGCAMFTTAANGVVGPAHNRMPVILERHEEASWLDPGVDARAAVEMLDALPDGRMNAHRASRRVNDVRADGPDLWNADGDEMGSELSLF